MQAAQRRTDNMKAAIAALDDLLSTSGLRPPDGLPWLREANLSSREGESN